MVSPWFASAVLNQNLSSTALEFPPQINPSNSQNSQITTNHHGFKTAKRGKENLQRGQKRND
jgi:hypothetical protein